MKTSSQIVGLPVISIIDGTKVGTVESLVVNADQGSIDFLIIQHEDWQVSVKAVPFKKIIGVGEFAVTIENSHAILDLTEIPIANDLVAKKIKISGAKVMTRKGDLLGEISEYLIAHEDQGRILGLFMKGANEEVIFSSDYVITFGKDIIVVQEDVTKQYVKHPEQLLPQYEAFLEKESVIEKPAKVEIIEELLPVGEAQWIEEIIEQSPADIQLDSFSEKQGELREKQMELLEGKEVTKDILNRNAEILVTKGTVLKKEDILKVHHEGPAVMIELSMSVRER